MEEKYADTNLIFSEEFFQKDFWKKTELLSQHLLTEDNIVVGEEALCFEDRKKDSESGHKWFLNGIDTNAKLKSITSNKFYTILDVKNEKDLLIKIKGDSGRCSWIMADRFLVKTSVLIKMRMDKLDKIKKLLGDD